jgi:hypothetical protein
MYYYLFWAVRGSSELENAFPGCLLAVFSGFAKLAAFEWR